MSKSFRFQTSLKHARGFGSGKSGTGHFWQQRVTGVAALLLSLVYVVLLVKLQGDDYGTVMATLGNPFVAVLMLAFLGVSVWHMKIGMQVIIEDYVNQPLLRVLALMANSFFSALVGIASAAALIKITFGA
ncbi:MAG: sdhD [Proteobacteria bacterium]|nr:sdhD [Pseudomonadota bacterium]